MSDNSGENKAIKIVFGLKVELTTTKTLQQSGMVERGFAML